MKKYWMHKSFLQDEQRQQRPKLIPVYKAEDIEPLIKLVMEARDYVTNRSYHSRESCLKDLDIREKRLMAKVDECEAALAAASGQGKGE